MPLFKSRLKWGAGARGMRGYPRNDTKTFTITLKGADNTNIERMLTTTANLVNTANLTQQEKIDLIKVLFANNEENAALYTLLGQPGIEIEITEGSFKILVKYLASLLNNFNENDAEKIKKAEATITLTTESYADSRSDDNGDDTVKVEGESLKKILEQIKDIKTDVGDVANKVQTAIDKLPDDGAFEEGDYTDFFTALGEAVDAIKEETMSNDDNSMSNDDNSMSNDGGFYDNAEEVVDAILSEMIILTAEAIDAAKEAGDSAPIPIEITGPLSLLGNSNLYDQGQDVRLGLNLNETDRNTIINDLAGGDPSVEGEVEWPSLGFSSGTDTVKLSEFVGKLMTLISFFQVI